MVHPFFSTALCCHPDRYAGTMSLLQTRDIGERAYGGCESRAKDGANRTRVSRCNVHQQLVQWLRQSYPKPSVDEVCKSPLAYGGTRLNILSRTGFLNATRGVVEEHNLNPATDIARIKEQVESQLLMSDLTDTMVHRTASPASRRAPYRDHLSWLRSWR